jgi:hypothetical protein
MISTLINTEMINLPDGECLLVDVVRSKECIGSTTITGHMAAGRRMPKTQLFFMQDEPVLGIISKSGGDVFADKIITQIGTIGDCPEELRNAVSGASDNYFTYCQTMNRALQPVLESLYPGLYVCHEARMVPGDGAGHFFWGAYGQRHEVIGSAQYNRVIGKNGRYVPCFLVPTLPVTEYRDQKIAAQRQKIAAGKNIGGLAIHLSGMYSVLLNGHHSATACLLEDKPFNCLLIEPLTGVELENEEFAAKSGRTPRIAALACPHISINVEDLPSEMLENFLRRRAEIRPVNYSVIRAKGSKIMRVGKRAIDPGIETKATALPDIPMIESAHKVTELTDEQLQALIHGEVELNGEIIISKNHYNSIIVACDYLQYSDYHRFITFILDILNDKDMMPMYKLAVERVININDKRLSAFFQTIVKEKNTAYESILTDAENYLRRFRTGTGKPTTSTPPPTGKEVDPKLALSYVENLMRMSRSGKASGHA